MEKKVVNIAGKQYVLHVGEFDEDFQVEDFLKIDYSNLVGELVTFPIIENRIGLMLADAEKLYLLVTGDMYHSGFAESASFINNRPYEVINF